MGVPDPKGWWMVIRKVGWNARRSLWRMMLKSDCVDDAIAAAGNHSRD